MSLATAARSCRAPTPACTMRILMGAQRQLEVAVITGAAQGIGRRTAEVFAERGYALGLIDLREPGDTVRALDSRTTEVLSSEADMASKEAVTKFARAVDGGWAGWMCW